eukprot:Partr_v1_DN28353_c1_g1_i1_m79701 putative Catenin (Cadherin-associated protein)
MYTTTSKQIMAPVAEAISELMMINLEAESGNTLMPDLTDIASVVDAQARNLVNVGLSMLETGDAQLKVDMPPACDEILKASTGLVSSTVDLQMDPKSKAGRDALLAACSGLLEGTLHLLSVYDDQSVRQIVNHADVCISNLEQLKTVYDIKNLIALVKPTCQQIVDLTHISKVRVDEILFQSLKDRLNAAIDGITKISPLLVSSSKTVAQNPKNLPAVETRALCVDNIIEQIRTIREVVLIKDHAEDGFSADSSKLLDNRKDVSRQLEDIMKLVKSNNAEELNDTIEVFHFSTDAILDDAREVTRYGSGANVVLANAQILEIEKVRKDIKDSALDAVNGNDISKQKVVYAHLKNAEASFRALEATLDQTAANLVRDYIVNHRDHADAQTALGVMYNSALAGDSDAVKRLSAQRQKDGEKFQSTLELISQRSDNPQAQSAFRNYRRECVAVEKMLDAALASVAVAPADSSAKESLLSAVGAFENQIKQSQMLINKYSALKISDMLGSDVAQFKNSMAECQIRVAASDQRGSKEQANNASNAAKRFLQTIREEVELVDDPQQRTSINTQIASIDFSLKDLSDSIARADTIDKFGNVVQKSNVLLAHLLTAADYSRKREVNFSKSRLTSIPEPDEEVAKPDPALNAAAKAKAAKEAEEAALLAKKKADAEEVFITMDGDSVTVPRGQGTITVDGVEMDIVEEEAPQELSHAEAMANPIAVCHFHLSL